MIRQNLRILSNSAKFSAGRPYLQRIVFGHNGLYLWHLSFGPVASLTFLATENMPRQLRTVDRAGGSSWQSYRIIATRPVSYTAW